MCFTGGLPCCTTLVSSHTHSMTSSSIVVVDLTGDDDGAVEDTIGTPRRRLDAAAALRAADIVTCTPMQLFLPGGLRIGGQFSGPGSVLVPRTAIWAEPGEYVAPSSSATSLARPDRIIYFDWENQQDVSRYVSYAATCVYYAAYDGALHTIAEGDDRIDRSLMGVLDESGSYVNPAFIADFNEMMEPPTQIQIRYMLIAKPASFGSVIFFVGYSGPDTARIFHEKLILAVPQWHRKGHYHHICGRLHRGLAEVTQHVTFCGSNKLTLTLVNGGRMDKSTVGSAKARKVSQLQPGEEQLLCGNVLASELAGKVPPSVSVCVWTLGFEEGRDVLPPFFSPNVTVLPGKLGAAASGGGKGKRKR